MTQTLPSALGSVGKVGAHTKIAVVGLGYVGLPLAIALARTFEVIGFDLNEERVQELINAHDRTNEVDPPVLRASSLSFTKTDENIRDADIHIITVPTPVHADNSPDLQPLLNACAQVGKILKPGAIVIVESTVYPGVTEDQCGPTLEKMSGMISGQDFFLGYSPERINPGDKVHTVDAIIKVVAGQNDQIADILEDVYAAATTGGTFRARNIKTAEAAKVIENAQRDINIAFINESTMIFQKLGISAHDVLETAATKWNFLNFTPGLVGGHCIGVDPFYLAHMASELGHNPDLILTGRRINESMGPFIARRIGENLPANSKVLLMGLTFKENVPDLRNTKVKDIMVGLQGAGHEVLVHDPLAVRQEARDFLDIELEEDISDNFEFDAVICAVAHEEYRNMTVSGIERMIKPGGLVADIKGIWRHLEFSSSTRRWQL
jgi:UDP-N-acetyl-D-glucosamine/UDP-N-acetyl-D-galactosamine dehydrogenase